MNDLSTLIICNSLLDPIERENLVMAAINAHDGHAVAAEEFRVRAGYGNLPNRSDADLVVR